MPPLLVNVALTGMVPQKTDNPAVPLTADEIVADARRCFAAGATIIHVHVRDAAGQPDYRPEAYAPVFERIRSACPGVLISGTCSGRTHREFAQRSAVLDCHPDFGSLTLGSMNFATQASVNDPAMIRALAVAMQQRAIVPEWEIFDLGMADYAHYLVGKGLLSRPFYANILLGSLGTLAASAFNLATVVRALPEGTIWSGGGIGRHQFPMNCLALAMGGHVRVGLEDGLFYDTEKQQPATNLGLVERAVSVARAMGRTIATPAQARELLGLAPRADGPLSAC